MIINAENMILGRIATVAAKNALLGEIVHIVNCDKALITGTRSFILNRYKERRERGVIFHGPYQPKRSDLLVKRTVRGMLSYKQERGRNAFARVRCYRGVPDALKGKEMLSIEQAKISKVPNLKYTQVGEICKLMGEK